MAKHGSGISETRRQLDQHGRPGPTPPHDGWAQHYDAVMEESFGIELHRLTARSLDTVRQLVSPPAAIVDFGAGTGRIAIPLARVGFEVTAVDPAPAMLNRLGDKASQLSIDRVYCDMASFRTGRRFDLALCVFSVIAHMLDHEALTASCAAAAAALRPGGLFLVDLPEKSVFESFDIETDDLIRCVEIEPIDRVRYRYNERGALTRGEQTWNYEDAHSLRRWDRDDLTWAMQRCGFELAGDYSDDFAPWGASYLLFALQAVSDSGQPHGRRHTLGGGQGADVGR